MYDWKDKMRNSQTFLKLENRILKQSPKDLEIHKGFFSSVLLD